MSVFTLKRKQFLPISINESWGFFSNPDNLRIITPPSLGLEITSKFTGEIYEGMIITYNVSPFPGYSTTWVTEITHVNKPYYFTDEQKIGPYKLWHHQHLFKPEGDDGTTAEDLIHYSVPYGPLGTFLNKIYIRKNLDNIFDYRFKVLKDLFLKKNSK